MSTQAIAVTNAAIERRRINANSVFFGQLLAATKDVALVKSKLTTDDVWERFQTLFPAYGPSLSSSDRSTLGPVMLQAQKDGIISKIADEARPSSRPSSHRRLLRVFKSNLVQ